MTDSGSVTDGHIAWGVVANAGRDSHKAAPRWVHVANATGLGSTSSKKLCRSNGFDPDETCGGVGEDHSSAGGYDPVRPCPTCGRP